MKELVRTNDPVRLSWIEAMLSDQGIDFTVFDQYTSAVEGSIGALPRRLMVEDRDFARARRLLNEAEPGSAQ